MFLILTANLTQILFNLIINFSNIRETQTLHDSTELRRGGPRGQQGALGDCDRLVRQVPGDGRRLWDGAREVPAVSRHGHGDRHHGTLHDEVNLQVRFPWSHPRLLNLICDSDTISNFLQAVSWEGHLDQNALRPLQRGWSSKDEAEGDGSGAGGHRRWSDSAHACGQERGKMQLLVCSSYLR